MACPKTKQEILDAVKKINKELNITVILVSHLPDVQKYLADRVILLEDGEIADEGSPDEICDKFMEGMEPIADIENISSDEDVIHVNDVFKRFYLLTGGEVLQIEDINFKVQKENILSLIGPSGAGKSTLLNLLGGLDSPTSGTIEVNGKDISTLTGNELADYRASTVGFVFQFYNLIPTLTVHENVALVKEIAPDALDAKKMIEEVGLSDHLNNFPAQLSGGEQQRVSIARALTKNPKILLCDEPTGALDSETGVLVLKLLLKMAKNYGKTIVVVTHNQNIAKRGH